MKDKANSLLFITGAGAEITWLYAWGAFLLVNCFKRLYPLPESIVFFSAAAVFTLYPRGRGWRVIQIIGVHLSGLVIACLWMVHTVFYPGEPFRHMAWLADFFNRAWEPLEGFLLVFVLGYTVVFWIVGIWFARRPKSYSIACIRFDRGLAAFFFLFLTKLVLETQMKVQFQDSMPLLLVFPFFIFGLTEIGLSRGWGGGSPKDFLEGYRAVGMLCAFICIVLVVGAGVFLLFLPYLKAASLVGYEWVKSAARPMGPILIALLRFLFGHANTRPAAPSHSTPPADADALTVGETSGWMLWVEKILMWGAGGLLLLLLAAGICVGLWFAVRWLFSRQPAEEAERAGWGARMLWDRLQRWLRELYGRIFRTEAGAGAARYYAVILRWGSISGLPHQPSETPREYGLRLTGRFPKFYREITLVVEMVQQEVYGETPLSPRELTALRRAVKTLRAPWLWPLRLKSLVGPGN